MIERVKSGISGLDEILNGGFIKGTNVLLAGSAGTGKTIFCMQFLYNGVVDYDEPGIFVTLEEMPAELRREAALFGWDFRKLEEEKRFAIVDAASSKAGLPTGERFALRRGFDVNILAQEIYRTAKEIDAKRIVIDSIAGLGIQFEGTANIRTAIFRLSALLREIKCTSLMTSEVAVGEVFTRYGVEEFIAQGVVLLFLEEISGELRRSLIVRKMRGTAHSLRRYPFEISPQKGFVVMPGGEI
ncbi:MAG: ATPase domain-containing protein [Candidatus Helarchaeota archaeon]